MYKYQAESKQYHMVTVVCGLDEEHESRDIYGHDEAFNMLARADLCHMHPDIYVHVYAGDEELVIRYRDAISGEPTPMYFVTKDEQEAYEQAKYDY